MLRRDRAVVIAALAIIMALAWAYVLWLSAGMAVPIPSIDSGAMPGMEMASASEGNSLDLVGPGLRTRLPTDLIFIFVMWVVMMVGMMTPSVAPMLLLYAAVGRKAHATGRPVASVAWFLAGYLLAWVGFSLVATSAQWFLASVAALTPMLATASATVGGLLFVVAGLYQWTPLKDVCLRQCQAPIAFLASHGGFRSDPAGALRLGMKHGLYCLGCCWALMAILFVGGVMNVLWIAGIAVLILLEKTVPTGRLIPRLSGALIAAGGVWLLASAL
jgi:predicted metal-binding membrane protein